MLSFKEKQLVLAMQNTSKTKFAVQLSVKSGCYATQKVVVLITLFCLGLLLIPTLGLCDVPQTDSLDSIQNIYANNASLWAATLTGYATRLFWILVLIDFVWMAINLALNPGEFSDITANLIRKVFFIGFFSLFCKTVRSGQNQ